MIEKILLPIEQLDPMNPVLRAARRHFSRAEIHLLHALRLPSTSPLPLPTGSLGEYVPMMPDPTTEKRAKSEAEQALHALGQGEVVLSGNVVQEIVSRAAQGYDLILMGTAGKAGLERLLLGSVAEGVLRDSPIPVMTVRKETGAEQANFKTPFQRGMLLTDASPWAGWGEDYVKVAFPNTTWQRLHVVQDETQMAMLPLSLTGIHLPIERNQEKLEGAAAHLQDTGGGEALLGDPAQIMLQRAQRAQADLLAISTRPRGPLERFLYGPVAAQVVRQSPVPVLVARFGQKA